MGQREVGSQFKRAAVTLFGGGGLAGVALGCAEVEVEDGFEWRAVERFGPGSQGFVRLAGGLQRLGNVAVRDRAVRIEFGGVARGGDGCHRTPELEEQLGFEFPRAVVRRRGLSQRLGQRQRLLVSHEQRGHFGDAFAGGDRIGFETRGFLKLLEGALEAANLAQRQAEVETIKRHVGIEVHRATIGADGRPEGVVELERHAELVEGCGPDAAFSPCLSRPTGEGARRAGEGSGLLEPAGFGGAVRAGRRGEPLAQQGGQRSGGVGGKDRTAERIGFRRDRHGHHFLARFPPHAEVHGATGSEQDGAGDLAGVRDDLAVHADDGIAQAQTSAGRGRSGWEPADANHRLAVGTGHLAQLPAQRTAATNELFRRLRPVERRR